MKGFLKRENLYLYRGTTYGGNGGGNNNGGGSGGGYSGNYNGGDGNGPRERLRKKPREIFPTEKGGIPFKVFNTKRSTNGGDKGTPRYFACLKKTIKCKTRAAYPLPKNGDRARTGREAGLNVTRGVPRVGNSAWLNAIQQRHHWRQRCRWLKVSIAIYLNNTQGSVYVA